MEGERRVSAVVAGAAVVLVLLMVTGVLVVVAVVQPASASCGGGPLVPSAGAYLGGNSGDLADIERAAGRQLGLDRTYSRWGDKQPSADLLADRAAGRLSVLSIKPDSVSLAAVAAGTQDGEIRRQAAGLREFGSPVLLSLDHEPEQEGPGQAAAFVAAWRHYVQVFRQEQATNVTWTVVLMAATYRTGQAGAWYPGDDVVDWIGADGYNWFGSPEQPGAGWSPFNEVFGEFVAWASPHGKPLIIGETAAGDDPADPGRRGRWIDAMAAQVKAWPQVKAVAWYQKGDWQKLRSPADVQAFTALAADPYFQVRPGTGGTSSGTAGTPVSTGPVTGRLPETIGRFSGEQVVNAAQVVLAAKDLGIDARGQAIGVMTAIGESSLVNIDYGDAAGPDSRGIFQQRDNGAWGTLADRMNPRTAASNFFTALLAVPGWQTMQPTLAAHAVQRNADPTHYTPFWDEALEAVGVLTGDPDLAGKVPATPGSCPAVGGPFTGPGGPFTPEQCSVVPDPTTGRGCLTPRTLNLATQLQAQGWTVSCWDAHAWNPTSDHPHGRACDVFPGTGGVLPTPEQKARGDALAASLQASAPQTGISYLIWYGQIWSASQSEQGWQPYNGGGVYDPQDVTGGHYDHVHASLL